MKYFFKHVLVYFLISFLATILFIFYSKTTNYSGAQIGMAPFVIILYLLTSIGITSLFTLILKIIRVEISILISSFLFSIIYLVLLIFYFHSNPFQTNGHLGNLKLWFFLSEVLSFLILNMGFIIRKKVIKPE